MARRRGENWERSITTWLQPEFGCTKIELRVGGQSGGGMPISSFSTSNIEPDQEVVTEKVQSFLAFAQEDVDSGDYQLRASYYVCAIDDRNTIMERSAGIAFFKSNVDDEAELESPNPKGHLSQMMRHNEALIKMTFGSLGSIITTQQQMLAQMQRRDLEVAERQMRVMVELEEAHSARHERELETRKQENREKRMDQLLSETQKYLPQLANRLMMGPVKTDATGKAISGKLNEFMALLPADKMPQILELLGEKASDKLGEVLMAVNAEGGEAS